VIEGLLKRVPAAEITAAVRHPAKAAAFATRGVRVEAADYDEPATLRNAFEGADRVLLISSNDIRHSLPQHTAVVEAARRADVGLLAYTSLLHADTSSLMVALPHQQTEPVIRGSGVPFTFLRNNLYTEHYAQQIRQAVQSGTLVGSAGQGRVASATRADLAAAAVAAGDGHENKVYELSGDVAWSLPELVAELSKAAGREISYENVTPERHHEMLIAAGLPPIAADVFVDTYRGIAEGQLAETSGDLRALIGRPTTSLAEAVAVILNG
jgi:NAD(P)H dehydrogenase (quinone)